MDYKAQEDEPAEQFFLIYLGVKGDWPWLRKVMGLKTGPTSSQKCHICEENATWTYICMQHV